MSFILSLPNEILRELGARLRMQRLAQSLSQRELAHMAGLSLGALRKLETDGQCSLETLIRANGEFLSFDELLEKVCGTGIFEQRDIMDGTLYSLTRKMRRMGFFITQRGHRYRIR